MLVELNTTFDVYGYNEFSCKRVSKATLAVAIFAGVLCVPRKVNGGHTYTRFTRVALARKFMELANV